jgi:ribonuclease BN (tRNA processing enzyme)
MIELLLVGTGAGPSPKPGRGATAHALLIDGATYVIDCGSGVGPGLANAGVSLGSLSGVFITHHHFDHVADVGAIFVQAWASLKQPVPLIGPPPIARMLQLYLRLFAEDFDQRVSEEGRTPLTSFIDVMQFEGPGAVFEDPRVSVDSALVRHPPMTHAYAYRFRAHGKTIVFSGDTAASEDLASFARGADVLVHEAVFGPAVGKAMSAYNSPGLLDRIGRAHTLVEDAGEIAAKAEVGTLILAPLSPAGGVSDDEWHQAAASKFKGEIIVGRDGLRVPLA